VVPRSRKNWVQFPRRVGAKYFFVFTASLLDAQRKGISVEIKPASSLDVSLGIGRSSNFEWLDIDRQQDAV